MELFRVSPDGEAQLQQVRIRKGVLEVPEQPSIAVQRFEYSSNISRTELEFLGDGLSEDISTQLSKYKQLFVIARNSAFAFDNQTSVQQIASTLGVRYIVQGSVRVAGNRARIGTQLIDGRTEQQLWADTYDRELVDLFEIQDEVSKMIVSTIAGRLADVELNRGRKMAPLELKSYGWLLKGQDFAQRYNRESNAQAKRCFKKAIELSPNFARAYAALSRTLHYDWQFGWDDSSKDTLQSALEFSNRAVELDEGDPRGYAERGFVYLFMREIGQAVTELSRALQMNPNDADIMAELGDTLHYRNELDEAHKLISQAMRLNPFYPDRYLWYLADVLFCKRHYRETVSAVMQMHNPNMGRRLLTASYAQLNELDLARAQAQEVLRIQPDFSIATYIETQPDEHHDNLKHFVDGLRKAGLPE